MKLPAKRTLGLIGLGIGLYLIFLISQFPAALAWQYAPAKTQQQIHLAHIQGSIWSGRATGAYLGGQELGKISWRLHPFSLLLGDIRFNLRLKGLAGELQGDFTLVSETELQAHDVHADLHAEAFNAYTRKAFPVPLMLRGQLKAEITSLQIQKGKTLHMNAKLNWQEASIEGVQSFQLGNVNLNAEPDNGGSRIKVQNQGGPLEISGKLQLAANGSWNINLGLLNRDNQRKDIASMLSFLGRPDTTGRYHLKQSGRLPL